MADADVVFISGCGRSGTTWLAEIVNYDERCRLVFEPFRHDVGVPVARTLGYWRYLPPDARDPEIVAGMRDVLEGRVRNPWTDQFGGTERGCRLVKEIRAHFLLGWLRAVFPQLPIVLILRHPCAVAVSEIRMGWTGWQEPIDAIHAQSDLLRDHLAPYLDAIESATSTFERRIVLWCVRNLVPLRQLASGEAHLVFYEHLLNDPMSEIVPLFEYLGRPIDEAAVLAVWRRPSRLKVAHAGAPVNDNPLSGWQSVVTPTELTRALELLDRFGFGGLYGPEPMPNLAGIPPAFRVAARRQPPDAERRSYTT